MAKVGRVASLATSYDIAFLHRVLAALEGAKVRVLPCTALPFKSVSVSQLSEAGESWIAAVNLLLLQAKCQDDVLDEGSWKGRVGLRLLSPRMEWAVSQVEQSGFPAAKILALPQEQSLAEALSLTSLDALALPTSKMLGEVFGHLGKLTDRPDAVAPLRHLGQAIGAMAYLKDAADDRVRDQRRGRFNALDAAGVAADHSTHIAALMRREMRRADLALEALGPAVASLRPVLSELAGQAKSVDARPAFSSLRRRTGQRGICEILECCVHMGALSDCCGGCASSGGCEICGACAQCPTTGCGTSTAAGPAVAVAGVAAAKGLQKKKLGCPACSGLMEVHRYDGFEVDECSGCHGLWLDRGELEMLGELKTPPERLLTSFPTMPREDLRPEGARVCPHCACHLNVMAFKGTRMDLCTECQGMFLDQGELNALLQRSDDEQS